METPTGDLALYGRTPDVRWLIAVTGLAGRPDRSVQNEGVSQLPILGDFGSYAPWRRRQQHRRHRSCAIGSYTCATSGTYQRRWIVAVQAAGMMIYPPHMAR